jgi:hypothetical protein
MKRICNQLRVTTAVLVIFLAAATCALADPPGAVNAVSISDAWTTFQGDSSHSGYVPVMLNTDVVVPLWQMNFASGDQSLQSPLVAIEQNQLFFGGYSSLSNLYVVTALNATTGVTNWSRETHPNARGLSGLSLGDGQVFVDAFGHSGTSGSTAKPTVLAYSAADGSPVFATTHSGQWNAGGQPLYHQGSVFCAGGYYGGLDAYDASTGVRDWYRNMPQQYGWTPAARGDDLFIYLGRAGSSPGPSTGTLYAIDTSTGDLSYSISDTESRTRGGSVLLTENNSALTSNGGRIIRFDLDSKVVDWEIPMSISATMAADGDEVFVPSGGVLNVLNETTGNVLWSWNVPEGAGSLRNNTVVTDTHVLVSTDSQVYAVDRATRQVTWSAAGGGQLAVWEDKLFVTNSTEIQAFQMAQGGRRIGMLNANPTWDATIDFQLDPAGGLVLGENVICVEDSTLPQEQRNVKTIGVMEFAVGSVPDDAEVIRATILVDIETLAISQSGQAGFTVHAYAGDGAADSSDVEPASGLTEIGMSGPLVELGSISVELDIAYIESLIASGEDHLGLQLCGLQNGMEILSVSSEGSETGFGHAPRLVITYQTDIPEPSSIVLVGLGLAAAVRRRKRNSNFRRTHVR